VCRGISDSKVLCSCIKFKLKIHNIVRQKQTNKQTNKNTHTHIYTDIYIMPGLNGSDSKIQGQTAKLFKNLWNIKKWQKNARLYRGL
jgi:hypothetical protein